MAELSAKVEWYVGREVDFHKEVLLRDNGTGEGPYIAEWNIEDKPEPTSEELQVAGDEYDAEMASTQYLRDRETAMHELLPETMVMPAMLEQFKADRDGGKTLHPRLEEAVNIYEDILEENSDPEDGDQGEDNDDDNDDGNDDDD